MPPETLTVPSFVRPLVGEPDDAIRRGVLARTHPDYTLHQYNWQVLLDAFEGTGGFLTGDYLWPHPREDNPEFRNRMVMARYHNYVETIVDLYVRFIFTQGVKRSTKSREYEEWQKNVDGAGTAYTEFLKRLAAVALVNGHAGCLVDKTTEPAAGPRQADEQATVVASIFTAPSIADWRFVRNTLTQVKLFEQAPEPGIAEAAAVSTRAYQYLLWDKEGWARFDEEGVMTGADTPGLGLVPLVVLRPKPRQTSMMLGRALISNANVVRALYNRASEEDEALRAGAFSMLTVEVDKDGDVDQVRAQVGNVVGNAKAIVAKGTITYASPDQTVPGSIRENIAYLVQEVFRGAHVRYRRDSLAAESGESIRLQYTELNEMLQGFAKALAQCEKDIARAWFAWTATTPEAAQGAYEAADVTAEYPDEFFLDALMTDLEAWGEALHMGLGPLMTKRIKKRAVRRIEPEISVDDLKKIDDEIDAMGDEPPPSLRPADLGQFIEEPGVEGEEVTGAQ
jgi:hypothetical protein